MNLLSVDWDFFCVTKPFDPKVGGLYDWGSGESDVYLSFHDMMWVARASAFLGSGVSLPETSGDERGFWDRFKFSPRPTLYVAESHRLIYTTDVFAGVKEVLHYDAHHDAGYGYTYKDWIDKGGISCENWVLAYHAVGIKTRAMFYPAWKPWGLSAEPAPSIPLPRFVDEGHRPRMRFGRAFLCRSGAWSPPWLDDRFHALVNSFPGAVKVIGSLPHRVSGLVEARVMASSLTELQSMLKSGQIHAGGG